ncbi:monovalent cation/H+ antiporter complex subunit F [Streptomyces sp. TRM 70361]|uniref:monovalent cation/H+ antiporter complex subunit F n=1 Tax=Streptomyces sp. TRM 70361 TaxID=3116553 RepID=UPI002E7B893F|nr:monovalent cation/H+ antiporter complex subunit F [Streptomyces sp. TRM 70361]MEE1942086.1 monovalent cation/H+ antiporter complex subunit F [Streptomyces sp. TRM 70361]
MNVVGIVALAVLAAAALLTLVRLARGPGTLDRAMAVEVLVTTIVAGAGVAVAVWQYTTAVFVLLVLALLGFIGAVTAARLVEEREDMR